MAETTNLKNINFMSKERFDSLTDIDDSQLYAVEMMIDDEDLVHTTLNETIDGIKTFNSSPIVPTVGKSTLSEVASVEYVSNSISNKADKSDTYTKSEVDAKISNSVVVEEGDGYIKFSSGSIIQWGVANATANPTTVLLNQPFINTDYSVTTTNVGETAYPFIIGANSLTTTQFKIGRYTGISGNNPVHWQAIGMWK